MQTVTAIGPVVYAIGAVLRINETCGWWVNFLPF